MGRSPVGEPEGGAAQRPRSLPAAGLRQLTRLLAGLLGTCLSHHRLSQTHPAGPLIVATMGPGSFASIPFVAARSWASSAQLARCRCVNGPGIGIDLSRSGSRHKLSGQASLALRLRLTSCGDRELVVERAAEGRA